MSRQRLGDQNLAGQKACTVELFRVSLRDAMKVLAMVASRKKSKFPRERVSLGEAPGLNRATLPQHEGLYMSLQQLVIVCQTAGYLIGRCRVVHVMARCNRCMHGMHQ